jgi:hypothetical protein
VQFEKMKDVLLVFILLTAKITFAQSTSTWIGAQAAGVGYASATLSDGWSMFNNVGGLGRVKQSSGNVAYEVSPALVGANRLAASYLSSTKWGTLGVGLFRFGDALYNEHLVSVGYGHQVENTSLGARVNYLQYRAESTGTLSAVSVDVGGITQISKQVVVGAFITNLTQSTLPGTDGERLPVKLIAGIRFQPTDKVFVTAEIEKDIAYPSTWKSGLEYNFYKKIFFRTGFHLNPAAAFFGLGLHQKTLHIDYAVRFSSWMGMAHQISASYLIPAGK